MDSTPEAESRLCPGCVQKIILIVCAASLFVGYTTLWQDAIDSAMILLDAPYLDLLLDFIHTYTLPIWITSLLLWLLQAVIFPVSSVLLFQAHIALFGEMLGIFLSYMMMLLGACVNFWIVKILSQGLEKFFDTNSIEAFKQRMQGQELKCIIALRLLPLPCFDVISYLAGMSCSFKTYFIGSALGIIPALLFYSYIFTEHGLIEWGFWAICLLGCIILLATMKQIILKKPTHLKKTKIRC